VATNWEVVYKALADFADLQKEAAKSKAVLEDLKKAAESEGQTEADAALKAAAAHETDTQSINRTRDALLKLAAAAKATNEQLAFGGRQSMSQHLSDLDTEKQKQDLLNRARWLNFSSPQQAEAFQQQVYQQTLLRNRAAHMGYSTPDQYLNFLDQERARTLAQAEALKARSAVLQQSTQAYQDQGNAVRQVHESLGTLGTTGTSNIQGYQAALAGLPDSVTTKVTFDDQGALRDAVLYGAAVQASSEDVVTKVRFDSGDAFLDLAKLRAEMAALKGTGISSASGYSQLTSPAIQQMQTAFDELSRRQALTASPASFTGYGISQMNQSMRAAYPQPPHMDVANDLRSRVAAGEFGQSGGQLPTRGDLAAQYGVSTGTIDKALSFLRTSGIAQSQGNKVFASIPGASAS